jgi:hypothetical protein
MKLRKKRDSQPMTWAESMKPLALYSMRASATWVEVTVFAAVIVFGIDHAGEAHELLALLEADLLFAGHQQVAVGQHLDHRAGDACR